LPYGPVTLSAQTERSRTEAQARRVNERIQALHREAERLAGEARTLVGDLRQLEIERDLQVERLQEAQAAVAESQQQIQDTTQRLTALEHARVAQLPDIEAQLVDVYKRGRTGYARLIFGANGVREFSRATRAVAALVRINERRIGEHRRTLDAVRAERAALEMQTRELQAREAESRRARAAAERALAAHSALIARIDAQRDLNAQLAGELQLASERLQEQLENLASGRPVEPVSVPLAPFRGALDWPAVGRVIGGFGQPIGQSGSTAVRNGIEIAVPEGTPVRAVHSGTVSYADAFTGFGNLVIVDHGANAFSLYGYLRSMNVMPGAAVYSGAEIGRAGAAPAGPSSLYFEVRIDGRSVDPVQWLRAR
jgi:septal ring factor EnvC (AmiA/AmiB activator)